MKKKSWTESKIILGTCTHSEILAFCHEEYQEFVHDNLEIPRLSNEDRDSLEETLTCEKQDLAISQRRGIITLRSITTKRTQPRIDNPTEC